MDVVEIRDLEDLELADLQRLIRGYTADALYRVSVLEEGSALTIVVHREPREQPYVKKYEPLEGVTFEQYAALIGNGFCLGAYDGEGLVGVALAEKRDWNSSLWVWELHVEAAYRGLGLGRRLMEALLDRARAADLRTVVCETQNTNAPAVDFYRRLGFRIEGVDLSYYSNDDYPDGEVALSMKRRLTR